MTKRFKSHTAQPIKRLCKRFTAAVLVLLLIVMFIPSAIALGNDSPVLPDEDIPETLTRAQLEAHGAVARLRSEESDEFTFVYLNEDGTRTSYSYGVAVKYEENGEYIDKNNTIKDFNSEYGNTASDVELKFPKKMGKIKVKYNDHNIKIEPITDAKVSASVNGNTVTYYGAFGLGMDLRYASTMSGMKEDIILQSYQGVNSFSFEVDTDGLELKQINGQYVIADGETAVFSFGDLEVTDSFTGEDEATDNWDEHMTYAQGAIQTVKANKEYIFTITVDEEFLTADTTVYPVNIDPTFNITSNYIQDTYICEGSPAANFGSTAQMKIGYGASTKRNRILMKLTSFVGDASRPGFFYTNINSAVYKMYCTTTYTSQPYVDVYRIPASGTWSHTGATWNNAFSATSDQTNLVCSTTVGTAGWYTFDVKTAFRAWCSAITNNGLMFRMRSEGSSPNYYRHFSSVNVANSAQLPYLEVNYGEETEEVVITTPDHIYLEVGETFEIGCRTNISQSSVIVTSSNNSIASVSQKVVRARSVGTVTITAASQYDPTYKDICQVTVVAVPVTGVELNYTTAYVAKGKTLTATATVSPSNASHKAVTWSSSNESVAEVNATTGVITAKASGTATITATTVQGNKTDTMTVIVPEFEDGVYYLQNKSTNRYADIEGPTNDSGAIIHQWDYHGYASQQWEFTLLTDGYYKIKSMHSNLYLSVQNNSSADNTAIIQSAYTGATGQQWKVELLANGHYKITAKCGDAPGEQSDYVLASEYYLIDGNGFDVKQRLYVDDTNFKDEWLLEQDNSFHIIYYYDQGYAAREQDELAMLNEYHNETARRYYELFGINLTATFVPYTSKADECKMQQFGGVDFDHKDAQCTHSTNCLTTAQLRSELINDVGEGSDRTTLVLWTGHRMADNEGDRSNSVYTNHTVIITPYASWPYVKSINGYHEETPGNKKAENEFDLFHELAHQLGAPDHYCYGDENSDTACSNLNCYKHAFNNNSKPICVMSKRYNIGSISNNDNIFCSSCDQIIINHIADHH